MIRPHFTDPALAKRWDDAQAEIDKQQAIIDDCDHQMRYVFLSMGALLIAMVMLPAIAGLVRLSQPEPFIGPPAPDADVFVGPPVPVPPGYIGPMQFLVLKETVQ